MPITSRSFVRSTLLFLVAGLLVLLAIVGAALWQVERTQDYVDEVVAAREVRSAVADLRNLLQDAETGQRGYLLTQEDGYLRPYDAARAAIEPAREKLLGLAGPYPETASLLDDLTATIGQKLDELDQTIVLQKSGRRDEALAIVETDAGQAFMARARVIFMDLVAQADRRLNDSIAAQQSSATALRWIMSVGALAILLVVGGSTWTAFTYTRELAKSREEVETLNAGLEERVRERTSDLGRANEEIQRFAYIVTHDLRAPLVNIMGFTAELEGSLAPMQALVKKALAQDGDDQIVRDAEIVASEDLPEAIQFIRSSTKKMDGLINAILKLSREGRRPLKPERVALEPLLRASAETLAHQVSEASGELQFEIAVPAIVSDRLALEQIFGNLLDNAVKYRSPDRPLRLNLRATPTFANLVSIEIEDNGRGIAPQDRERVFDLFRRSGSQDQAGEGIGLAHVRSMVSNLGGDISLESKLGQGTTFRISLPRDLAATTRRNAA